MAETFNDYNYKRVFDLVSMENGGVKGQYRTNAIEDTVNFTITPNGVNDLLSKNEKNGALFLRVFEFDIMQLRIGVFSYKKLLEAINEFANLRHLIPQIKDDTIERFNIIIASNNNLFKKFNKVYEEHGISFDYPPLSYVRKTITNTNERDSRINAVNKRIRETNVEINALEKDIKELSKKSLFTRLYNKLTGKEDIKKTIENKSTQNKELKLTLQILNDELNELKNFEN